MTATLLEANKIKRILLDLGACLKNQLEDPANGVPRPCTIAVTPGETVTPEYQGECEDSADPDQDTDCGLAWVRLMTAYPAAGIGEQDTSLNNCNSSLGFDINIGITRCFDPGPPLEGPDSGQLADTAFLSIADMLIMQKAIKCCSSIVDRDYIIHGYAPIGPLGGMVGGSWTLSMAI